MPKTSKINYLLVLALILILLVTVENLEPQSATVVAYTLTIRESPSYNSIVLGYLEIGEGVLATETSGEFVKVNGRIDGWTLGIWLMDRNGFRLYAPEGKGVPNNPDCVNDCWITNKFWFTPVPKNIIGRALVYGPVTGQANRLGVDLDEFYDGCSLTSPANVGDTIWVRKDGGDWVGPCIVIDTSQRNHAWYHAVINKQVVEVGSRIAREWGMIDSSGNIINGALDNVEVWVGSRAPLLPTFPEVFREYYLEMARFANPRFPNWIWTPIYSDYHTGR